MLKVVAIVAVALLAAVATMGEDGPLVGALRKQQQQQGPVTPQPATEIDPTTASDLDDAVVKKFKKFGVLR